MAIRVSKVYKCLERKTLIIGFEIFDIFLMCILLAILNLIFSGANFKIFYTWVPTIIVGLILRFGKKGKPDNFLVHWVKFQFSPGVYHAFSLSDGKRLVVKKNKFMEYLR